jgi:hypothetical protein
MQIRNKFTGWLTLAVFATVGGAMVAADPAFAKVDVDKLTISGEIRVRYEYRVSGTFGGTVAGNESAGSERVRVGVAYDLTPDVSFFAQLQDARVFGSECVGSSGCGTSNTSGIGTVSSANQNSSGVDLHQGYIQVKNVGAEGLSLKLGRQEIIYGDHRLFGNFGWSQVGNSFDAVKATYATRMADVDLFWARIIDTEVGAGCAAGNANCSGVIFNTGTTRATTDQDIYGAYVTLKPVANWTIEPYYFLLADNRTVGSTTLVTPQASDQSRSSLGTRINGKAGGLDTTAEGVWQFGSIASGGAAQKQDLHINAHAEAVKIGYTMAAVPMKPRLGFEFDYASGDDCVTKGTCVGHLNTFDNLYPTNHGKFGYMDLMAWKNMVAYQIVFDIKPSDVSKLQVNYSIDRLARTTDNWYRASQGIYAAPTATNQAASLGQEIDVHYWHTFKEKFKFELGYGHFFAGEFLDKSSIINKTGAPNSTTNGFGNSDQNWGYVMTSILF